VAIEDPLFIMGDIEQRVRRMGSYQRMISRDCVCESHLVESSLIWLQGSDDEHLTITYIGDRITS